MGEPVAEGEKGSPVTGVEERGVEVAGDDHVDPFAEPLGGEGAEEGGVIPAVLPAAVVAAALPGHPLGNPGGDGGGHHAGCRLGERAVEDESKQAVGVVAAVHLVAVAEVDPLPLDLRHRRAGVEPGAEGLAEEGTHVKIVVSLQVDDGDAAGGELPEPLKDRQVVCEGDGAIPDPEFEEIAEDVKGVDLPPEFGEEFHEEPVVFVRLVPQVGIGDEDGAHGGTINQKTGKGKAGEFIMGFMRDVEILWEDLLEAFDNPDSGIVYFLDRDTGEIFAVPADYDDEEFWHEIDRNEERFLRIPGFEYEDERLLLHDFIRSLGNEGLRGLLERAFEGKKPYGRLDEILSFYPEEYDRFMAMKEELIADRARRWLEEHDLFAAEQAEEEF